MLNARRVGKGTMSMLAVITAGPLLAACEGGTTAPSPPAEPVKSASLAISFAENPAPFTTTGCNPVVPQGWYTQVRIQETGGVSFTPSMLIQKVDGKVADFLQESFNSRFGACAQGTFTPGTVPANGAVCGVAGVCTSDSYSNYQLQVTGTDANGRSMTFDSPVLQFGGRSVAGSAPGGGGPAIARPAASPPRFLYIAPP
jgi:hypothetical protein